MCQVSSLLVVASVSDIHAHLCPHHNVWPEAVYCCLHCLLKFSHDVVMDVIEFYQCAKFHFLTL